MAENAEDIETNWDEVTASFDHMGLKEDLLKPQRNIRLRVSSAHITQLDTISAQSVILILAFQFRKTFCYSTACHRSHHEGARCYCSGPIRYRIDRHLLHLYTAEDRYNQAKSPSTKSKHWLAPTRETAQRIQKVVVALGVYMKVECHAAIDGTSVRENMRNMGTAHVIVVTPGRVFDMINRNALKTEAIKIIVLDEADEMLSRGFREEIYDICQQLPTTTQVVLLSATMPTGVLEVTEKLQFMRNSIRILVTTDETDTRGYQTVLCICR